MAAVVVTVITQDLQATMDLEPGSVARDQDHRLLAVPGGGRSVLPITMKTFALGLSRR